MILAFSHIEVPDSVKGGLTAQVRLPYIYGQESAINIPDTNSADDTLTINSNEQELQEQQQEDKMVVSSPNNAILPPDSTNESSNGTESNFSII